MSDKETKNLRDLKLDLFKDKKPENWSSYTVVEFIENFQNSNWNPLIELLVAQALEIKRLDKHVEKLEKKKK